MVSEVSSVAHPANARRGQEPFTRAAPVLSAALLMGAGGGFVLATVLTTTQATRTATGPWWSAVVQAHGHLQLYGWAGLFIVGVAIHFLPRLRGTPLRFPGAVPWVLGSLVTSLVLRGLCQPLVTVTGAGIWRGGLLLSGVLEFLAIGTLMVIFVTTARSGPPPASRPALWSVLPFLLCAFAALGLASIVNLINMFQAAFSPLGMVASSGDDLNVTLGLLGFIVPMALAMSARSLPMYAGLDAFPRRTLWPTAFAYIAGVALAAVGGMGGSQTPGWSSAVYGGGMAIIGAVLLVYVGIFVRIMRTRGRLPRRVSNLAPEPGAAARKYQTQVATERGAFGPFVALVGSAYLWAIIGGLLLVINGLAQLVGGSPVVVPDAARHSLALGFIALLISGVAPRMVPGFSGGHILTPALVRATLWLGNGAAILRVGALLVAPLLARFGAAGTNVDAFLFGLSGPVGLALAICLAINLWPAIWPANASTAPAS